MGLYSMPSLHGVTFTFLPHAVIRDRPDLQTFCASFIGSLCSVCTLCNVEDDDTHIVRRKAMNSNQLLGQAGKQGCAAYHGRLFSPKASQHHSLQTEAFVSSHF